MIPKRIFTIWLNENSEIPELVQKCIESQKIPEYEHQLITLQESDINSIYVNECIEAKKWIKAADYLRLYYIYKEGGIFLDGDMEVLEGKNFDDLLDNRMFVSREFNGFILNSGFGSEAGHPFFSKYMYILDKNFKGDGDMVFEPGLRLFNDMLTMSDIVKYDIKIYPTDYFCCYNWQNGEVKITENTRVYHHYLKAWGNSLDMGIK